MTESITGFDEEGHELKFRLKEEGKIIFSSLLCPIVFSPFDRTFDTSFFSISFTFRLFLSEMSIQDQALHLRLDECIQKTDEMYEKM